MSTKLLRCHNCPRTFVGDVTETETGEQVFPLCPHCGYEVEEQEPGKEPKPSLVERRILEEKEVARIEELTKEEATLEARIVADKARLKELQSDRRARDQDKATEEAFKKGKLPEIERRGAGV